MRFYTSVVKVGSNLFHRFIEDGERKEEIIEHFDYELYVKSDYSQDALDVYNNTLKHYKFDSISAMNEFIQEVGKQNVYGNTDPVSQFISKAYPEEIKLSNDYVVLNFDIETEHSTGKEKYKKDHVVKVRRKLKTNNV